MLVFGRPLADDFRAFLLGADSFELALSMGRQSKMGGTEIRTLVFQALA